MTDPINKSERQAQKMRATLDYGVGTMIIFAGIFFFSREYFDMTFNERFPPNYLDKVFGILCVAYGAWRIYRGYKKTQQG